MADLGADMCSKQVEGKANIATDALNIDQCAGKVVAKLKALKPVFKQINQEDFTDLHAASILADKELKCCQETLLLDPLNPVLQQEELNARVTFTQAHKNYQSFLHQKAKTSWTRDGDDNTAVFHASLKAKNNQNRILSIVDAQGTRVDDPGKITEVGSKLTCSNLISSSMVCKYDGTNDAPPLPVYLLYLGNCRGLY
ncbi:hypothetical protein G4B88_000154 [Cannabis sativa]|uniref:Uncharacterized protein n=1 Tax=Cannabis sativa TaxID=3483 RepID=A0A7J6GKJ6_CANSA|nr:hypothetical protein G4B88_000154 [Cannabis sativa]